MKTLLSFAFGLLIASAASAQTQMSKDAMSSMKMPAASKHSSVVWTDAVVQNINTAKNMIVLKHGDITNLSMPAMTMGFDVANKKMLNTVKAGDKVRFHVELLNGAPTVTHLETAH
ncbi:copper-binding protein [Variovorax sp. RHLX14]|uniref:copper-binding protein n=1 Tax=Variovorax sp. RHLX14 TaxID=1259731 RepID=UPI003F461C2A